MGSSPRPGDSRGERMKMPAIIRAGALLAALLLAPALALAHGTVSHIPTDADFGAVVGRYQFLIENKDEIVRSDEPIYVVLRVIDLEKSAPLAGARVLAAPRIPQGFRELPSPNGDRPAPGHGEHGGKTDHASPPPGSFLTWGPDGRPDLSGFSAAPEGTEPGHYLVSLRPVLSGPHLLQVALLLPGREGRPEVLLTQLPFKVSKPAGLNLRLWVSLGAALLSFVLAGYALRVRHLRPPLETGPFDLLSLPWLARALRSPWWQPVLQAPFLLGFGLIIWLGLVDTPESSRNLATLLMWTLWWAGVIFTFILAGRLWCVMCPIGAVNEWANRWSGASRQLPRRLRTLWPATALFLLLTWADGYWGIVKSPYITAWVLLAFFAAALLMGALFARRTFCRYVCPIGGVIALYSMAAPVELRAKSARVCREDPDKCCYTGSDLGRGCPMFEFPQRMDSNAYCIYCGECLKTCDRGNLALRFRAFGKDLWAAATRRLDEAFLAVAMVAVAGMAAGHMVAPWHGWMDALTAYLPWGALADHARAEKLTYTLVFSASVVLVPLAVYGAGWLTWRLAGRPGKATPYQLFVRYGYAFLPLGLAMHLAHNLPHLFLEGPLAVPVLQKTVNLFTPWFIGAPDFSPGPWLELPVLQALQTLILLAALLYSLYTACRLSAAQWGAAAFSFRGPWPYLALILLFTLANLYLLNLPMDARHG